MSKREKVIRVLRNNLPYLRKNFGVTRVALFGSYASGKATKESDIDLLVEFKKPIGLAFMDMVEYLEKALGSKTDILTPAGIKSMRVKSIAESIKGSLIYV